MSPTRRRLVSSAISLRLVAILAAFATARLFAQQTITFSDGDTRSSPIDTTAPNSPITLDLSSGSATQSGDVTGSGAIAKTGDGTLALTGTVSYTGATTITAGTLQIGNGSSASLASSGVTNDGTLVFDGGGLYFGVITGSGAVVFQGTNSNFILTKDQTYTGGTTIAAGSGLQLGSGGTTGSVLGNIVNNGTLTIDRSNDYTYAGDISGSGSLILIGDDANVLTLSGNNSYTGGTTISAPSDKHPVVRLASANALGLEGSIKLFGGTLQFSTENTRDYSSRFTDDVSQQFRFDTNGQSVTFATGLASTDGTLTKLGDGTLTLSGASTYTGATTITAGTLRIGDGTTVSLASSNIVDGSALVFDGAGSYSGVISGAGTLAKSGSGTMTLTANQTYTGATSVSGGTLALTGTASYTGATTITTGTLQIGNGTTASFASSGVTNDGTFVLDGGGSYSGVITGSGAVVFQGTTSNFTLTSDQTYTGGTTIAAGSGLQLGSASTTGSVLGDIVNNGTLAIDRSNDYTYAGNISGSGSLILIGYDANVLTLSGNNSYTGGTTIAAPLDNHPVVRLASANALGLEGSIKLFGGTLQFSTENTRDYSSRFTNDAAQQFRFDTNGQSVTFATGLASAGGTLTKLGAGTLMLSGANTYTGATSIEAGTLALGSGGSLVTSSIHIASGATFDPSAAGGFTLASGGTLTGSGSVVGHLTIAAGGTLSPGASPGLFTVNGDLSLLGSTLMEIAGAGPRGVDFDAIDVEGTIEFGGALNVTLLDGFDPTTGTRFDLFNWTGASSGTFTSLNLPTLADGLNWDTSSLYSNGTLSVSAIPEPASVGVIAGSIVLVLAVRRRRSALPVPPAVRVC